MGNLLLCGICLLACIIFIYEDNKHSCVDYMTKDMKSCDLKDGYYHITFEFRCRLCDKKFKKHTTKVKDIQIINK